MILTGKRRVDVSVKSGSWDKTGPRWAGGDGRRWDPRPPAQPLLGGVPPALGLSDLWGAPHPRWASSDFPSRWASSLSMILVTLSFYYGKKNTAKCRKKVGEFWKRSLWRFTELREQSYGSQRGFWDGHENAAGFNMENQQGPAVQHRELCSILCNNLNGKRIWKRIDTCIIKSLCCYTWTNYCPIWSCSK